MKTRFFLATIIVVTFFVCTPALVSAQFNSGFTDPFNSNQNTQANPGSSTNSNTPGSSNDMTTENGSGTSSSTYSSSYFRCGSSHYHLRTYDDYDHCCPYTRHHTTNVPIDGGISILLGVGALYGFRKAYDKRKKLTVAEPAR
jgi:hypothetical protein